jgi:hypothetical protein
MITRVILSVCHNLAGANVTVQARITDDVEGTDSLKVWTLPDTVLPADFLAWEKSIATGKSATLAATAAAAELG